MSGPTPVGRRRVVVTGAGAVTPLGNDVETFWSGLVAGRCGIDTIASFDPSRLSSRMAGQVRDLDVSVVLDRKEAKRTDRFVHLTLVATREALERAGLPERAEGAAAEETGAIIASGMGGCGMLFEEIRTYVERGPARLSPFFIPMTIANMAAGHVSIAFGAQGPSYATVSACASGGNAIGEAAETIRRGDAEVMIAGGTEAPIVEGIVGGFAAMRALSTRNDDPAGASRPFDRGRDGFVIAEGAATLILEEAGHAVRRGAPILAELVGYGATADASHVTLPAPGGSGARRAAARALQKAALRPDEVDHVSAHATSTGEGDAAELVALRDLFGEAAPRVSITASKGAIGHTLGAAGAIGTVAVLLAMRDGCVPPTINLTDPDPLAQGLDCTPLTARERRIDVGLVSAFGFGGHNSALVLRRWDA
ncbi:MAG TPA: beta-ketoacyl-ACP synthase II [Candidatus Limnocylindrales bacterium]|nr:beta-ketoacyl-ACP synthase II [Candidatus Limnocylindrales bacterium]